MKQKKQKTIIIIKLKVRQNLKIVKIYQRFILFDDLTFCAKLQSKTMPCDLLISYLII